MKLIFTLSLGAQALQMSNNYRELEKKYGALTTMMSSQNQFITQLEKQCQCRESSLSSPVRSTGNARSKHASSLFTGNNNCCFCFVFRWSEQEMTELPKGQSSVHRNYSSEANEMTNDVQRDQSVPLPQQAKRKGISSLPTTTTSTPTDAPFVSFPVTKSPGTSE